MKISVLALSLFSLAACNSCSSPETKRVEAASAYAAQQSDCIVQNKTREAIDACRDKVKAAWDADAGVDGGHK